MQQVKAGDTVKVQVSWSPYEDTTFDSSKDYSPEFEVGQWHGDQGI